MANEKKNELGPEIPLELPLFLTDDLIIFPGVLSPIIIQDPENVDLINEVLTAENKLLTVVLKKPGKGSEERSNKPYPIGCVGLIVKMARVPDGSIRLLLQGLGRVKVNKIIPRKEGMKYVALSNLKPGAAEGIRVEALMRNLKEDFNEIIDKAQYLPSEMKVALINISDPGALADFIASNLNIKPDERQEVLAAVEIEERLTKVSQFLARELQLIRLGSQIQD